MRTYFNAYLYGTRFMSYLSYVYTPEKLVDWLKRGEDSERYYSKQFEKVFGLPLEDSWDQWNSQRDRVIADASSWHHTDRYYTGAQDLDAYGRWVYVLDHTTHLSGEGESARTA